MNLLRIPCHIVPRVGEYEDRYGSPVMGDGTPTETVCWWYPLSAEEQTERPVGTTTHRFYLHPDDDVPVQGRIEVEDRLFEIAAPAMMWRHPVRGELFQHVDVIEGPHA